MMRSHEARSFDSMQKQFFWMDHFVGDQLQDEWNISGDGGYVTAVIDGELGGVVRLTTHSDYADEAYMYWANIRPLLVTKNVCVENRVKPQSITNMLFYAALLQYDSSNHVAIIFESSTSLDKALTRNLSGGVGGLHISNTVVTADYHLYRIQCSTQGGNHVHSYIDGVELSTSPDAINVPTDYLQNRLHTRTLTGATIYTDYDYTAVRQDR